MTINRCIRFSVTFWACWAAGLSGVACQTPGPSAVAKHGIETTVRIVDDATLDGVEAGDCAVTILDTGKIVSRLRELTDADLRWLFSEAGELSESGELHIHVWLNNETGKRFTFPTAMRSLKRIKRVAEESARSSSVRKIMIYVLSRTFSQHEEGLLGRDP